MSRLRQDLRDFVDEHSEELATVAAAWRQVEQRGEAARSEVVQLSPASDG